MRPKKKILCVESDEQDLSVLSFMLQVNGYRVLKAANSEEAVRIFISTPVELVIAKYRLLESDGEKLIAALKKMDVLVPMVLLCEEKERGTFLHHADALLTDTISSLELLERIRVMSARKRGPRKGSHRVHFPVTGEKMCPTYQDETQAAG